jgi:hypothetical protein
MKSSALRRWLALPFLLAAAAPALAATPAYIKADRATVERRFGAVVTGNIFSDTLTPYRKKLVADSLKKNPVPGCAATAAFTIGAIVPLKADDEGTAWEERYDLACTPAVRRSALITVTRASGGIQMRESVPGHSLAEVRLRNQFMPKLLEAAAAPGCTAKKARVVDSHPVSRPEKAGEPWTELWKVDACGKLKEIEVALTPGEGGSAATWQFTPKETASTPAEAAPKEAAPKETAPEETPPPESGAPPQ